MQIDYTDEGMGTNLQATDGLSNSGTFVSGFDLASSYERGGVTGYNLGNFSFNAGTGGTITLTGEMTIKNSAGTTIIDSQGLLSSSNFQFNSVVGTSDQQTTSQNYVDVVGGSLSVPVTGGTTRILCFTSFSAGNNNVANPDWVNVKIDFNGTAVGGTIQAPGVPITGGGVTLSNYSSLGVISVAAGTYTLKGQFKSFFGGNSTIQNQLVGYLILGV